MLHRLLFRPMHLNFTCHQYHRAIARHYYRAQNQYPTSTYAAHTHTYTHTPNILLFANEISHYISFEISIMLIKVNANDRVSTFAFPLRSLCPFNFNFSSLSPYSPGVWVFEPLWPTVARFDTENGLAAQTQESDALGILKYKNTAYNISVVWYTVQQ